MKDNFQVCLIVLKYIILNKFLIISGQNIVMLHKSRVTLDFYVQFYVLNHDNLEIRIIEMSWNKQTVLIWGYADFISPKIYSYYWKTAAILNKCL